ncbi:MAG TPA: hypothetical protein VMY39_05440, partial [Planctomycetota bacterium]|nr:hypothetical protein [Planctomycetota bacterium]
WVWEKFMFPTVDDPKTFERYWPDRDPARPADGSAEYVGRGPRVTVLDRATGKTANRHLPYLLDAKSKVIWKPLFKALRNRLAARGLADTPMLGTPSDVVLRKEHFDFFNEVAPGLPWVNHSHMDLQALYKSRGAKLGYATTVFGGNVFPSDPHAGRHYGWQRKELHAYLLRNWGGNWDHFPVTSYRHLGEVNIAGNQRGIGHLGAEFWSVVKDKRGNRRGRVYQRYPEGNWRSNDICTSLLAPGADGPVTTHRYEAMREGVQECEARIFIERALTDATLRTKLGPDLARRAQELLDDRITFMMMGMSDLDIDSNTGGAATNGVSSWWNHAGVEGHKWFVASGWRERTRRLFATAGEVARRLATH